jgi:hypothetical protein
VTINEQVYRDAQSVFPVLHGMVEDRKFVVIRCYHDHQDREIRGIITRLDPSSHMIKVSHDEGFDYIELNDILSIGPG